MKQNATDIAANKVEQTKLSAFTQRLKTTIVPRKVCAFVLSFTLVMGLLPIFALAENEPATGEQGSGGETASLIENGSGKQGSAKEGSTEEGTQSSGGEESTEEGSGTESTGLDNSGEEDSTEEGLEGTEALSETPLGAPLQGPLGAPLTPLAIETITSFVGVTNNNTSPLITMEVGKNDKSTIEAIGLPTELSVHVAGSTDSVMVPVTWVTVDGSDYANTSNDRYKFKPVLPTGWELDAGVELPFATVEIGWIERTNAFIAGKDADYAARYYNSVSFESDGSGSLTWQNAGTAEPWNGMEAESCPLDTSSPGLHVFNPTTPGELLYALHFIQKDADLSYDYSIVLQNDLNLKGDAGYLWPADIDITRHFEFDGNDKTIYNLYMLNENDPTVTSSTSTAFISKVASIDAHDLDFCGANILGRGGDTSVHNASAVFVGRVTTRVDGDISFKNIGITDATVVGRANNVGTLVGRFIEEDTRDYDRIIDNCNASRVVNTGLDHVGGLTGAVGLYGRGVEGVEKYLNRCYAVDTTIVAFGGSENGHSGGLFSCLGGNDFGVTNCFVDASVYGQSKTGVFTGSCNNTKRVAFMNCFSSGFVDGSSNLGGFVGSLDNGPQTYFFDCYSTALVGVNNSGPNMGGFVGYAGNNVGTTGPISGYSNCYAAGEVGTAKTISDGAAPGQTTATIGGFLGNTRTGYTDPDNVTSLSVIVNCFYDKQTTGMREYDVGSKACLCLDTVPPTGYGSNTDTLYITNIMKAAIGDQGLQGCLTTTTEKSGAGLVAQGGSAKKEITTPGNDKVFAGYTGMREDSDCFTYYNKTVSAPGWSDSTEFAVGAYGWDDSNTQHYPELLAFKNNLAGFSTEDAAVAAAYSLSSTSTVKLETWEKGLQASTGLTDGAALPATTYDTVRDITSRFWLTSDGTTKAWDTTSTQDGETGDKAQTTIKDITFDVLDILEDVSGTRYCDNFHPGVEWLEVESAQDGATATRRLRVTPSASLDPGDSHNVYQEEGGEVDLYDHADDVVFYYTTAARWLEEHADVTTGVYPDTGTGGSTVPTGGGRTPNPIQPGQTKYANDAATSLFNSFFGSGGQNTNDLFGYDGTDTAEGLNMSYMSRDYTEPIDGTLGTNSANGSSVYTYIRPILAFDPDTGAVWTGGIEDTQEQEISDRFNGYAGFVAENTQYLIEYVWKLDDGRLIRGAKILTVKSLPFTAQVTIYEAGGIAANDGSLKDTNDALAGAESSVTAVDPQTGITYGTTSETASWDELTTEATSDSTKPYYGSHVVTSWKVTNPQKQVTKLKVEFEFDPMSAGSEVQLFSAELENPKPGDVIEVPYTFWRIVALENGTYYSIPQTVTRRYTVGASEDGTVNYLYFDKKDETDPTSKWPELTMNDMEDNLNVSVELSEALLIHKDTRGDTTEGADDYADLTRQFDYALYYNDGLTDSEGTATPGTYGYQIWDDNGTPDDYSDDFLAPNTAARPNAGSFVSGTDLTTPVTLKDASGTTEQKLSLCDGEYVSILGGRPGYQVRVVEADYGVNPYNYTPLANAEKGSVDSTNVTPTPAWPWEKVGDILTAESRDTGAFAMPSAYETNGEEINDTSTVRVKYTNQYKKVVPSGVADTGGFQWWLLVLVVAALMIVFFVTNHAMRQRRHNERLQAMPTPSAWTDSGLKYRPQTRRSQGKHSKR